MLKNLTCSEQSNCSQICKLGVSDVQLGQGLNVVMDPAHARGHLLDVDGGVVPGQPPLLVRHDDAQQGGDGHLSSYLG